MSDYQAAGIKVAHNLYVLRTIILDLAAGLVRDANERRFIGGSKQEIALAIADLSQILEQIERADTSRTVCKEGIYGLIVIRAKYDDEARVWYVEHSDLFGVHAEGATFDELRDKLPSVVRDMIEADSGPRDPTCAD